MNGKRIVRKAYAVRMVGRNPRNPKSRAVGLPTEQRFETELRETSNCITTVWKDSMVLVARQVRARN